VHRVEKVERFVFVPALVEARERGRGRGRRRE